MGTAIDRVEVIEVVPYKVAFAQNVRLGFRAFHRVTPCKIEKVTLFRNTSTSADNGVPLFLVLTRTNTTDLVIIQCYDS